MIARAITVDWQTAPTEPQADLGTCAGDHRCGRIVTAVATRMKAFGMKVIFYDHNLPSGYEKAIGVRRAEELSDLQREASIISIHTPMEESTAGLVDKDFVDALNRDTILVNTSRGGVVKDTDVIAYGLAIGQLSAVALDVLPQEPPSSTS